jgi:hypothetical protein
MAPSVSFGGWTQVLVDQVANIWSSEFTYTISKAPGEVAEVIGYEIAIVANPNEVPPATLGYDANPLYTNQGASDTVTNSNPNQPDFVGDGKYAARIRCWSPFGSSPYAYQNFTIPSGPLGGEPIAFTFDLIGKQPDKLIVNSIALPALDLAQPLDYDGCDKASKLREVIDTVAGDTIVRAISRWDPVTGQARAALFDEDGNLVTGSDDFDLKPGEGYQVYTEVNIDNIVFQGK